MADDIPGIALSQSNPPGPVTLSDVISRDRRINVFAGFTRDISSVAKRLDDAAQNTTVLAPRNTVVMNLPRKPWEDPRDFVKQGEVGAYGGKEGEEKARGNLRRFVEAHIVPVSPWDEGVKVKSQVGEELWWEEKEGKKYIMPGKVEVESVADKVTNGELWIIGAVVNYE
ncbi:MAG: hypothetical protein M1814_006727 [Vezdaea aestivalis]|nr:MAG: hypothetical protein M1814_006727 [Vezdaea aestivalis]